MPKLLQINVTSNIFSIGKICEDIAKRAQQRGWETYIAYGRWAKSGVNKEYRIARMWNTYLHYVEQKLFDNEGLSSRIATMRLVNIIKKINPDIIQLHDLHDHYLNYPILFKYLKESNKPVVWTFHDCWAFTGRCNYFDMAHCDKWKTKCFNCPMHFEHPVNSLFDRSKRNFNKKKELFENMNNLTIVSCSQWIADLVHESFLKKRHIEIIHNGIDLSRFKPYKNKKGNTKYTILGVAAVWDKRKGLLDFIKLREKLSDDFNIILVGLNRKQISRVTQLGIIGITRTTSVEEMAKLYSDADVFVIPTYEDNFPTVNLEALACGTPVITYKTGGSPEAIDNKTGVIVDQGDICALTTAIKNMKERPLSSVDCRLRAERNFNKDYCFDKYIDLYEELMEHDKF